MQKFCLGVSESRVKDLEFACSCDMWNSYGLSAIWSHLVSANTDTHLFTCFSWISPPSQVHDSNQESNKPSWKVFKEPLGVCSQWWERSRLQHVLCLFMPSWTVKLHKNAERWVLKIQKHPSVMYWKHTSAVEGCFSKKIWMEGRFCGGGGGEEIGIYPDSHKEVTGPSGLIIYHFTCYNP